MGCVSDLKKHDVRIDVLSYGMMVAFQFNMKEFFDRIWRETKKFLHHKECPRKGYFALSFDPEKMQPNSYGSSSDGEFNFVTILLLASNRWKMVRD